MKKTFALLLLLGLSTAVFCQETSSVLKPPSNKYVWSIVPQLTAKSALRFDCEYRMTPISSIVIAPRLYVRKPDNWEGHSNDGKMLGLGGEVFHKLFITEPGEDKRGYIMYGLLYNYYDVIAIDAVWTWDNVMGSNVLVGDLTERHIGIGKLGLNIAVGMEFEILPRFIIDIYTGVGARYGHTLYGNKDYISNHTGILDMGYTGIIPILIGKLGVVF